MLYILAFEVMEVLLNLEKYVKREFLFTSFEPLNFCYTNEL